MPDEWDILKNALEEKFGEAEHDLTMLRDQMLILINNAKESVLLSEMKRLHTRLDAIEARLPEEEP